MKTLFYIWLLGVSYASNAQSTWVPLTTGLTSNIRDIDYFDENNIYLIDDNYKLTTSVNAGLTYTTLPDALHKYPPIEVLNEQSILLTTGSGDIYATSNGGVDWDVQFTSCSCLMTAIGFTDANHGIASGLGGVYYTENGGTNWDLKDDLPIFGAAQIESFVGGKIILIDDFSVYVSNDHGQSFTTTLFDTLTENYFTGLSFYDINNGFIMTGDGILYSTNNGGATWELVSHNSFTSVSQMVFVDKLHGFLVQGNWKNFIYSTNDGGVSWSLNYTVSEDINKLKVTPNYIYAVGNSGMLLRYQITTTGIDSPATHTFNVYPNPASQTVYLDVPTPDFNYAITNILGEVIISGKLIANQQEIDISQLATGMYVILNNDNILDNRLFVVE
ncbi:MAG: T9SS type A sorting domain-containing protein [Chitinophagaceae bacterium]